MAINWAPATTTDEVVQNVETLLATAPGTVPLSRNMGTSQDVVDQPMPAVAAKLQGAVIKAIRTYEPRVAGKPISYSGTADGRLKVTIGLGAP